MLWLYMNGAGDITCQVNIGNKIRQGNSFEVFLVIEGMNSTPASNPFSLNGVSYLVPDSNQFTNSGVVISAVQSKTFVLQSPLKANFAFQNGVSYRGYKVSLPIEATSFNAEGGHCYLLFSIVDGGLVEKAARLTYYVEPTFGKHPSLITQDDYSALVKMIEAIEGNAVYVGLFNNLQYALEGLFDYWRDEYGGNSCVTLLADFGNEGSKVVSLAMSESEESMIGYIQFYDLEPTFFNATKSGGVWETSYPVQTKRNSYSSSGDSVVYGIDEEGTQRVFRASKTNTSEGTVPMYDANGRLRTGAPSANGDCANKKYVDDCTTTASNSDIDALF